MFKIKEIERIFVVFFWFLMKEEGKKSISDFSYLHNSCLEVRFAFDLDFIDDVANNYLQNIYCEVERQATGIRKRQ